MTGATYPAFGVVFGKAINSFSDLDPHQRRHDGDRNALWFFLIAIISTATIGIQHYTFGASAAQLSAKLRSISFRAILRQDIEFFDKDENNTGSLTSTLSDNPQKINGLAGITLGAIVQSISTLTIGSILGLVFNWQLGLIGLACTPILVSAGYIRLRVVVLKDQHNKKAHEASAQLACEAAGAIRTVTSLTREDDCCALYSDLLEGLMHCSNCTAMLFNAIFALLQLLTFFIVLIFWFGSCQVADLQHVHHILCHRFNILLGTVKPTEEVTQEEFKEACCNANILEFIQFLTNSLDTQVAF